MAYDLKKIMAEKPSRFTEGHRMCAGCGAPVVARMVLRALKPEDHAVIANATGCMEVSTFIYPYTAWTDSFIHTAFENAGATCSGAEAAYKALKKQGKLPQDKDTKFIAFGGDGGTYDIGLQSLSGAMERGHDMVYVCYDNGAYMNTGIQRSSATPKFADTTTSPAGKVIPGKMQIRKDLTKIMADHHIPYVAQTLAMTNFKDLYEKSEKAIYTKGPAFLNVMAPCPRGWGYATEDLMKIKKEYAVDRRTVIEDGKEAVFIEKKVPEQEVMFIMDRFGYAKTIDMAAYERNKEAVHNEYKYIFSCMNTDKICIFTDNGMLHQIKVKDIPFSTKFRDKGTPIDNLGNYDSSGERIIYLCASERIRQKRLLFVTKLGMMKLVDTSEFDVMKKTVASTKLTDGDELIGIYETDARTEVLSKFNYDGTVGEEEVVSSDQNIILQTANGVFLKFPLTDVPQKKKNAVGVRGIKLGSDDYIEDVYILTNGDELSMDYKGKMLDFGKMKMAHRDTKGTKVRR